MLTPRPVHSNDVHLPTLRDVIGPVFRYRRVATLTFVAIMAATVTAAALATRTYEARMKILVNRERIDPVVSSDPHAESSTRIDVSEGELYSEIALLTSRDLLAQVARDAGLVASAPAGAKADASEAARVDRAVRSLDRDLDIQPLRKTTMIEVRYGARDPQRAARVLDHLAQLYLAKHLAVHRPAGARQFFADQSTRLHDELKAAETRLNQFRQREQVVSATEQRAAALQKLSEFESTLQQTEAAIADATRRIASVDAQLTTTPARHVTQVRDGGNVESIRTMKGQVLQLELKRSELLQKFTPQYPPVVQVEADIKQLQEAIAEAEATPLHDQTTDQNPTYQWLASERARVQTERDAQLARAGALRRTIAEYQARASRLDSQSLEQQELLRQVKTAEDSYVLYQRKQEEARIADELDRTRIANVALAEPPTVPQTATSPRRTILFGGTILAVVLSLGAAFLLHATSPYFRTPDEVYRVLDIPVLASLPASAD